MLRTFILGMTCGAALMAIKVGVDIYQLGREPASTGAAQCEMKNIEIDSGYGVSAVELREVCSG